MNVVLEWIVFLRLSVLFTVSCSPIPHDLYLIQGSRSISRLMSYSHRSSYLYFRPFPFSIPPIIQTYLYISHKLPRRPFCLFALLRDIDVCLVAWHRCVPCCMTSMCALLRDIDVCLGFHLTLCGVVVFSTSIQLNSNIYFSRTRIVLDIAVENMEKMVNKGLLLKQHLHQP